MNAGRRIRPRRWFLQRTIAGVISACQFNTGILAEKEESVFDVHLHLPSSTGATLEYYRVVASNEDFERYLLSCKVRGGVVSSVRSQLAGSVQEFQAGNRELARWIEKHPGFYAGCVVNPVFPEEAVREIEECHHNLGMRWVGELDPNTSTAWTFHEKGFQLVAEKVSELGLFLHVYANEADMASLLEGYPKVKWVFSPLGFAAATLEQRAALVRRRSTAWVDTSGLRMIKIGDLEALVQNAGVDRVVFGSGFPQFDVCGPIERVNNTRFSEQEKRQILWDNGRGLLG